MSQGVERECLRVDYQGVTSKKFHPKALGHKLTNNFITTDYAENLLEFITSPHKKVEDLYEELLEIHQFVLSNDPDELLWPCSMPAILPHSDNDIPVANYGDSNVGLLKRVYRKGLGHRYGKKMQSIAGIHFNFSLSDDFWQKYQSLNQIISLQEAKNRGYFSMIRNFKRYQWVLTYLFGASPSVDESFLVGREHKLVKSSKNTFSNPESTSLRMGGLGYTSSAQDEIKVCYNSLSTYLNTLENARLKSVKEYEKIGLTKDGEYLQLNTNLLQIDNEFYSTVRPKRTAKSRESALGALSRGGVEYIEIRILDVNPYDKLGFSVEQMKFMQIFLTTCLFMDSPEFDSDEYFSSIATLQEVVTHGQNLKPDLKTKLYSFFDKMKDMLELFPAEYKTIIDKEILKVENNKLLFSNRILNDLKSDSLRSYMLQRAIENKKDILLAKTANKLDLESIAKKSFEDEAAVKEGDKLEFSEFLNFYFDSIKI